MVIRVVSAQTLKHICEYKFPRSPKAGLASCRTILHRAILPPFFVQKTSTKPFAPTVATSLWKMKDILSFLYSASLLSMLARLTHLAAQSRYCCLFVGLYSSCHLKHLWDRATFQSATQPLTFHDSYSGRLVDHGVKKRSEDVQCSFVV